MIRTADLVREGRDAVIAARINGNPPARNPYNRHTKRHLFWKHGADRAERAIDNLFRIGA